jgi:hypothetical protein
MFLEERKRRIWSPAEMNTMAGDLFTAQPGNLGENRHLYQSGQLQTPDAGDSSEQFWVALWEADGYQNFHSPNPPNELWFRPLICGDKHLTYVGHIPPGGGMPPSPEKAAVVEMCIYTLAGELGCIVLNEEGDESRVVLNPHQAFHIPQHVPLGFWNPGDVPCSYILTFTPNAPGRNSIKAFHKLAEHKYGWTRFSAESLNEMVGDTLWINGGL